MKNNKGDIMVFVNDSAVACSMCGSIRVIKNEFRTTELDKADNKPAHVSFECEDCGHEKVGDNFTDALTRFLKI